MVWQGGKRPSQGACEKQEGNPKRHASAKQVIALIFAAAVLASMWAASVRIALLAAGTLQTDASGQAASGPEDELFAAAERGDVEHVKRAIGAQPALIEARDPQLFTLLHVAACEGDSGLARTLIHLGADPNARDMIGDTPLHYAVRNGRVKVARILMEAGARPTSRNVQGSSPASEALAFGRSRAAVRAALRGQFDDTSTR